MANYDDILQKAREAAQSTKQEQPTEQTMGQRIAQTVAPYARPALEFGGMLGGGALGAGLGPVGALAGGALGVGMGKQGADILEQYAGTKQPPQSLQESALQAGKNLYGGMEDALYGEVGGAGMPIVAKTLATPFHKVVKPILGRLSGFGGSTVDAALKGNETFTKAMRGNVSGQEVVDSFKDAVSVVKDNMASDYLAKFKNMADIPTELDISPVQNKLRDLMKQYRVKVMPDGTLDLKHTAIGNRGRKEIEELINTVWTWEDKTPAGIDALKRYIGDFYSKSSQARGFTSGLYKKTKDVLVKEIPEYKEMTGNYEKMTNLIKNVESNLMLRTEGIKGRITADQSLRRLMSTTKDDFAMRRELVKALGVESEKELEDLVAGYAMRTFMPGGLAGSGIGLGGALASLFKGNPQFASVLVAASPRVQGEFLRFIGKIPKGTAPMAGKTFGYLTAESDRGKSPTSQMPSGFDMQTPPDAGQHKGRIIENEKGQRFISDGQGWKPQ